MTNKSYLGNQSGKISSYLRTAILILFTLGTLGTSCTAYYNNTPIWTPEPLIKITPRKYASPTPRPKPSGEFTSKPWVDFKVKAKDVDGRERLGMLVHTKLNLHFLAQTECVAAVFFEFASGKELKDKDGKYRLGDQAGAYVRITPKYEQSSFSDLKIFMPNDQLHLSSGKHDLRLYVVVMDNTTGKKISTSDYYYFSATVP